MPTILVANEDSDFRRYVRITLEREGYAVLEASSAREALEKVAGEDRPSALVMDFELGEPNGAEVVAAVRRLPSLKNLPIVFVTATVPAWMLDVQAVLFKPVDPAHLVGVLQAVLQQMAP
jgi:CheY-like chemotaxis protein